MTPLELWAYLVKAKEPGEVYERPEWLKKAMDKARADGLETRPAEVLRRMMWQRPKSVAME